MSNSIGVPAVVLLLTLPLCSCEAEPRHEIFNVLSGQDCKSPVLLASEAVTPDKIVCRFDETVFCSPEDFSVDDSARRIESVVPTNGEITVTFDRPVSAGTRVNISGRVADRVGNTLSFTVGAWGYNDHPPRLVINEFTTKGSGNNPDRVELFARTSGNLAGITLYDGIGQSFDSECILPEYEVEQGDYIVIEYGEQLREVHRIEFSGGPVGLGANNGVITLCASPQGKILDAVLYSNRTSDSDTAYDGFGTRKVQERAALLQECGQWLPNDPVTPQSGVNSTSSTATRSFCRDPGAADSDSADDWHIVPTGKASFGTENTTQRYGD